MSKRHDNDLLADIGEAAQRIADYVAGMSYAAFLSDTRTQDAVIRNLEIMGEAAKSLSLQMRTKYADVPWNEMARMRDRLIHHYSGVNLDIVWQISTAELPEAALKIEAIVRETRES